MAVSPHTEVLIDLAATLAQVPDSASQAIPIWAWLVLVVIVGFALFPVFVFCYGLTMPSKCSICKAPLRRKRHLWETDANGKKHTLHLCPSCNSTVSRRKSKAATDKFFGSK